MAGIKETEIVGGIRRGIINYEVETEYQGTETVTAIVLEDPELCIRGLKPGEPFCAVYLRWEGLIENPYGLPERLESTMEVVRGNFDSGYFDPFIEKMLEPECGRVYLPERP